MEQNNVFKNLKIISWLWTFSLKIRITHQNIGYCDAIGIMGVLTPGLHSFLATSLQHKCYRNNDCFKLKSYGFDNNYIKLHPKFDFSPPEYMLL